MIQAQLKKSEADVVAIKRQADNQADTLKKVMDEKNSLEKQLRDFEDIVGEKGKKER